MQVYDDKSNPTHQKTLASSTTANNITNITTYTYTWTDDTSTNKSVVTSMVAVYDESKQTTQVCTYDSDYKKTDQTNTSIVYSSDSKKWTATVTNYGSSDSTVAWTYIETWSYNDANQILQRTFSTGADATKETWDYTYVTDTAGTTTTATVKCYTGTDSTKAYQCYQSVITYDATSKNITKNVTTEYDADGTT